MLMLALVVPAMSQEFDTTYVTRYVQYFNIPVTYFDYHDDNSTYDFGANAEKRFNASTLAWDTNLKGWADSTLTAAKLPRRAPSITDPTISLSYYIEKLFTPWVAGVLDSFTIKGDSIFPIVDSTHLFYVIGVDTTWYWEYTYGTTKIATPDTVIKNDTIFKNITIPDSLRFTFGPNANTIDTTDSLWEGGALTGITTMEGKGFGDFGNSTWTMSLHNRFTYHGGEVLYIGADDDFYVYINGKLVDEGGGFHAILVDSIYLDSLHLTVGQKYDFDAFYANRRAGGGMYISGITDFETKRSGIDTLVDTILTEKVPVAYSSHKTSQSAGFLGFSVPLTSNKVRLEVFSLTGRKLLNREIPIAEARTVRPLGLPRGMTIAKVSFYDNKGTCLSMKSRRMLLGSF
jgi:fibro-slime domain-containing protein